MTVAAARPLADPVAEGARLAAAADDAGVLLRVVGGVGVAMCCPSAGTAPLQRPYGDIDLVTLGGARDAVAAFLAGLGYAADREFNTLHGRRRLFFWDPGNERQVDVFVDAAELCHTIDFRGRLEAAPLTLAPADLLLMKLQVVETNRKDLLDICALLADHQLRADDSGVNSHYIAGLAASDWGLWRTLGMVAERAQEFARDLAGFEAGDRVAARLGSLRAELDAVPKTRGWKLRARVGEKKRWYALPEEAR